ncbi:MAG: substrate-binding domain-containing protein [Bacillota bacterium]|jgi:phosphate transport system substrate-binding protein
MKGSDKILMKKGIFFLAIAIIIIPCILITGCNSNKTIEAPFDASQPINVVSREDGSGTRVAFIELLGIEEKNADGTKKDHTTKEAIVTNKTDVMLINIAGDRYSIGYVSMGSLNNNVKTVKIDNVAISAENVQNGTYKLTRPFNIAIKGKASGLTKDFIDFILSSEGQKVVAQNYISIDNDAPPYTRTKTAGKIVVAGSSSVTPVMEKLREAYLSINPNAEIEVQQSDSTSGMSGVINGTCNIGMASRELKDNEAAELTSIPIALDGIAIIVNPTNICNNLSSEQAKNIFTGKFTVWDEIFQ